MIDRPRKRPKSAVTQSPGAASSAIKNGPGTDSGAGNRGARQADSDDADDRHSQPRRDPGLDSAVTMPSASIRFLLSLAVALHLFAITASFLSVTAPSETQDRWLRFVQPYLQATHFGLDDRPIYLADGAASEQPLRLQVSATASPVGPQDWRIIDSPGWPGLPADDRMHRWLATAAMLAESEQPSLVAELLLPVAVHDESIKAIRIRRLPRASGPGIVDGESLPYTARVVRSGDRVSLVQLQPSRLNATAVEAAPEGDDE